MCEAGWSRLSNGHFFVGAEDVAEGVADFAEGSVGLHGFVKERHEIFLAFGGGSEGVEAAIDFGLRAVSAEFFQAGGLAGRDRLVNLPNIERCFFGYENVYSDNDFSRFFRAPLVTGGSF